MVRASLIIAITFYTLSLHAQAGTGGPNARFVGKYDLGKTTIQFAQINQNLVLIVPGAPVQELKPLGKNKFQSQAFKDQLFTFTGEKEINSVISQNTLETLTGKKISSEVRVLSIAMDSLLTLSKQTTHFIIRYHPADSTLADSIATNMEKKHRKILKDFSLKRMPLTTVRVYPDLPSFHKGINFPEAPDQVLATAFGKDDIRMVSPRNAGPESWMLTYAAPHEFTHCVHLNIDYSPNNPRWLWEGVAQYEAGWFFDPKEIDFIKNKEYPSLASLNNGMEYMLGFVIIEAIKDLWGFDTVIRLIKERGDVKKVLKIEQHPFEEQVFTHIHQKYIKD
jgi:hypothetical protein